MTLLPAIFEADEAFAELPEARLSRSRKTSKSSMKKLLKRELIRKQREEVEKAGQAFADQQSKVSDLEQSLAILEQRLQGGTGEQIVLNREIARFQKNLDEAKVKSAELSLVVDDQARKLAALKGELGVVTTNFTDVARVIDVTANTVITAATQSP